MAALQGSLAGFKDNAAGLTKWSLRPKTDGDSWKKDFGKARDMGIDPANINGFDKPTPPEVAAPKITPVVEMPVADDASAAAAKRRKIAAQLAASGRASTILSDSADKLGN